MFPIDDDINELQLPGEPEPDAPGIYYITFYKPLPSGDLEDNTTRAQYRARNRTIARDRLLKEYPGASIVDIDFHDPDLEDNEHHEGNQDNDL